MLSEVSKLGTWVPHHLTDQDHLKRAEICTQLQLLSQFRHSTALLENIVTGDNEDNNWSTEAQRPHQHRRWDYSHGRLCCMFDGMQKALFCLSCSNLFEGKLWCVLRTTSTAEWENGDHIEASLFASCMKMPHVSRATRQKLLDLGWEALHHPPYRPDLAPSDFHLFWYRQNFLHTKVYASEETLTTTSIVSLTRRCTCKKFTGKVFCICPKVGGMWLNITMITLSTDWQIVVVMKFIFSIKVINYDKFQ